MSQEQRLKVAENPQLRKMVEKYLDRIGSEPVETSSQRVQYKERIKALLIERDAIIIAHYYTSPEIQALAEETAGSCLILSRWPVSARTTRPRP